MTHGRYAGTPRIPKTIVDGAVQFYLIKSRFIILTLSLENRFSYQLGRIARPSPGLANYQRYTLNCV